MLVLVTGGSRSGKSGFALEAAGRFPAPHVFLATAEANDAEMRARIEEHRRHRSADWRLVEEPLKLEDALSRALTGAGAVVIDCITLWLSNLILADPSFDEQKAASRAGELAKVAAAAQAGVIMVTNEVGSGIVPDNPLARRFRDCAGRANQVLARAAREVHLMVSGVSLTLR